MTVYRTIIKKIYDVIKKAGSMTYAVAGAGITVTAVATQIVPTRLTRTGFVIVNNSAQTVYLGGSTVTTANGIPLAAGASYDNQLWVGAFYGIVAAGTANVRFEDFY